MVYLPIFNVTFNLKLLIFVDFNQTIFIFNDLADNFKKAFEFEQTLLKNVINRIIKNENLIN